MFRPSSSGEKLKARTSMLVIHKSERGPVVEINCGACGRGVFLPFTVKEGPIELRKAIVTVPRDPPKT